MNAGHGIRDVECEGFAALELTSPEGVAATWVPGAGMICPSLRHRGAELLGQRQGLAAYARSGSTMGIPFLHPWANRLARRGYTLGTTTVEFPPHAPRVHDDGRGLPIHGLLAGCAEWVVRTREADQEGALLSATLDLGAVPDVMALFPFPHELCMEVTLRGPALHIETTLRASGGAPVPVAFGYHPYFRLPDLPRAAWEVTLPVRRRMILDERLLPTGRSEAVSIPPAPLGSTIHDDLYTGLEPEPSFVLAGGGRRIEVAFGPAYPVAVIYAPADDDVVCFEPMTAPTNPFEGGSDLSWVAPGEAFSAGFEVRVA